MSKDKSKLYDGATCEITCHACVKHVMITDVNQTMEESMKELKFHEIFNDLNEAVIVCNTCYDKWFNEETKQDLSLLEELVKNGIAKEIDLGDGRRTFQMIDLSKTTSEEEDK